MRNCRVPASTPRSISTRATITSALKSQKAPVHQALPYNFRLFSHSAKKADQTQTAPSAEAYLASGVIKQAENPVDLKKVLVIGSGGLSIGQAGEFDYSGSWFLHW
jgi:carbamoyl-phosphate synthase large subunit